MNDRPTRVLILAGDTDGNIGDRAIVYSTCRELRRLNPQVRITVVSGRPKADRAFFGAETVPRGAAGFLPLAAAAARADLILCGGGGLFQDDTSLIKMPYWAARLAWIRCFNDNIHGYSLGVGPLRSAIGRLSGRVAFGCMSKISVRDPFALDLARTLTGKPVRLVPDPALTLPPSPPRVASQILARAGVPDDGRPLIGIAARRWFHHRRSLIPHKYAVRYRLRGVPGAEKCERFTSLLADVLDRLAMQYGAHALFMPTYNVAHEADDEICRQVIRKMRPGRAGIAPIQDPRDYKAVCRRLSVMLGARMHPTIFCAAMGRPVVGLAYNTKFQGFFRLLGCEERVMTIDDFVSGERTEELIRMIAACVNGGHARGSRRVLQLVRRTREFTAEAMNAARPIPSMSAGLAPAPEVRES
jgi:polysaccharide pyruvyl transferase WcaK-like protein